ncbi:MAG: DNA polymerase III subunit delta' [Candidatus Omnitrophica bacterium]|nr:DNA polymerase III subunit delta' [Candidatus Omnitrophota bacterium]
MAFQDIKGQDRAIEFFRSAVNNDKLAHAYLFSGAPGLGKTLLARNLAKFLNCESPLKNKKLTVDCCEQCSSCRKISEFSHPDVHWIEGKGKSQKISIDEMRLAQKEISLKSYAGKYKIFIIQQAHNMTQEAANSLLKTLEEPPSASLMILTSSNISGLLPTIISRCQLVKFFPLHPEGLKQILTADYGLTPSDAHFLSAQAQGRLGEALDLKDQDVLSKKNRLFERISQYDSRTTSSDIFSVKDKKELAAQLKLLLHWFRDILVFKAGLSTAKIINLDMLNRIKTQAAILSFQEIEQIINKIIAAHRLIEQNVNPKIALEVMLLAVTKCKK